MSKSEIKEVLEDGAELLKAYDRPIPSSWKRNLDTLALLLAVHSREIEVESYAARMEELRPFIEAAFCMGVESQ